MQLSRCQVFASTCAFVQFGSLTQLSLLNTTARAASPPLFSSTYFHHIIRATSALLASCYHPHCMHQPHRHPHLYLTRRVLLDVIHAARILFSSTSYLSRRIVQLPSVPVREALTIHEARRPSRRIIFAIVFAAGSLTVIFIDIVLVASYCTTSHCPCDSCANNSRSLLIFLPHHICYCPCRRQPHRHPHRHCTHCIALYCTTSHCPCECCANNS